MVAVAVLSTKVRGVVIEGGEADVPRHQMCVDLSILPPVRNSQQPVAAISNFTPPSAGKFVWWGNRGPVRGSRGSSRLFRALRLYNIYVGLTQTSPHSIYTCEHSRIRHAHSSALSPALTPHTHPTYYYSQPSLCHLVLPSRVGRSWQRRPSSIERLQAKWGDLLGVLMVPLLSAVFSPPQTNEHLSACIVGLGIIDPAPWQRSTAFGPSLVIIQAKTFQEDGPWL